MHGEEDIPDIEMIIEVSPVDGDDGASIKAAIDFVSALEPDAKGFRGAVVLKKGIYQIEGSISINTSGVILRGEGEGEDGTVIIATGTVNRPLIKVGVATSMTLDYGSVQNIAEEYIPVGRKYLILDDASAYSINDVICVYRPGTNVWISDLKMDQIPDDGDVVQWTASSYSFKFERKISKISGDTILSAEDKELLIAELELDKVYEQEISKRWAADLASDSWAAKNIRPYTLAFLLFCMFIFIVLDSSLEGFKIAPEWIELLQVLLMTAVGGYFIVRGAEKITKTIKEK